MPVAWRAHLRLRLILLVAVPLALILSLRRAPAPAPLHAGGARDFLVLVTMFRDEEPYLLEWVAHHVLQGVTHFYLYDDGSQDGSLRVLRPLVARGLVTLFNLTGLMAADPRARLLAGRKLSAQFFSRAHFHYTLRRAADWVLYLDADEFAHACGGAVGLLDLLRSQGPDVGGVALPRVPFSTAGRAARIAPGELATLAFAERRRREFLAEERGKVAFRTRLQTATPPDAHDFAESNGSLAGDARHPAGDACKSPYSVVVLHYVARSLAECEEKRRVSEIGAGGWRHRVAEDDCLKRHTTYKWFPNRMYTVDEDMHQRLWLQMPKLCALMRELNPEYYRQVGSCSAYERSTAHHLRHRVK